MSRRLSERKAKIAASRFIKRLTGADDFDGSSSISAKRKLVYKSTLSLIHFCELFFQFAASVSVCEHSAKVQFMFN